jgi:hypothetical protein
MDNNKAIENICMILPVSEEEVKQINQSLWTPHTWHDIAKAIIKDFNKSYIDNMNMEEKES